MIFKKVKHLAFFILLALFTLSACQTGQKEEEGAEVTEEGEAPEIGDLGEVSVLYKAEIIPINENVHGLDISGTAEITVISNDATIEVNLENLPPDMMHLQHFHGFKEEPQVAACPTPESDQNNDGVIDLIETRELAGFTLVPLHDNPLSLEIKTDTYPSADFNGELNYSTAVSINAMGEVLENEYGIERLDFTEFVIFIHSVPEDTELPNSVQSLPEVPAHLTLPIACGKFYEVE